MQHRLLNSLPAAVATLLLTLMCNHAATAQINFGEPDPAEGITTDVPDETFGLGSGRPA